MQLMSAFCIDHFVVKDGVSMEDAIRHTLILAIFLVFTAFGQTYASTGKSTLVLMIDSLYHVVKLVLMAIILVGLK